MIVNLQNIMSDFYGNYEEPILSITTLSKDYICPVIEPSAFTSNFKFNDISEINFTVADKIYADGKFIENPSYEELIGMRRIVMEPFGAFVTINPKIQHDGKKTVKEVTAYSFEYTLNYKDMPPLEGTFRFYDPSGTSSDTIMDIVLESAPGWSIGYISPTVCSKYRTFSTSTQPVYSFLSNDCQTSFNCIFLYDTMNLKINVYDAADDVETLNIFLDSYNLLKGYDIEELSDEIVTCLSVYGADGISIRPVNVLASDKIYNLDYFINKGDIPEDIAAKWNIWSEKCVIYQRLFSDLYSQYYNDQLVANAEEAKLVDLQGELSSMNHVMDTYNTDVGGDHTTEKTELQLQINTKQAEVDAQQIKVDTINTQIQNDQELMKNIVSLCSFKNNFTDDDLAVINAYIREDSLEDSSFALTYVADEPATIESISEDNKYTVSITSGDLYRADDYADLTDEEIKSLNLSLEQLNELKNVTDSLNKSYLNHSFFKINSGAITINDTTGKFNLQGGIVNSTLSYSDEANKDGSYDCMIAFSIDSPNWNGDDVTYSNALFVVSGRLANFTYNADINSINTDNMSFILSSGILTLTCDSSIDMRQHMLQELYDYGKKSLSTLAYPAFEFSVDSSNFMSAEEFELFRQQLAIGKKVYLALKDDYYLEPILIGVEIDWMDQKTLKLTFSNKFRSNSPDFLLADTIGQASKTAASLDSNKFNYNAFIDSNIQNDVEKLIKGALDVAKNQIINSNGQNFFADSQGIHLVKLINPATGEYDPAEIRLINNQIVFTNDSWQSADLAIGKITAPDGSSTMGIVAQSLIGEVLIGNKLLIEATGPDMFTGDDKITHFRVDAQGASLANASFAIQGTSGNQILLDPNYGILAGNGDLFTMGENQLRYDFIDENGDIIYDTDLYNNYNIKIPQGGSFYFDIDTGSLAFKGDIYANNGYFKGTVNADKGYFKGEINVNDKFVVDKDGNMTAINADITGKIKATTLDCTNATVQGLEVGKNITMGANAVISWSQVTDTGNVANKSDIPTSTSDLTNDSGFAYTYQIPSDSEITQITNNAISTAQISANQITSGTLNTGTVKVVGNIYRADGSWDKTNFLIGINENSRLQVGSASSNPGYTNGSAYYSNGDLYFVTNGTQVESRAMVIESNSFVTIDSLSSAASDANRDTGTHRLVVAGTDGKLHASSTNLSTLSDGSLKTIAVFG